MANPFDDNPLSAPALRDASAVLGRGQSGRSGLVPVYRNALPARGQGPQLVALDTAGVIDYYRWSGSAWVIIAAGGGGFALTVQEVDGSPSDTAVTIIRVPNGSLTDNGVGDVTLTVAPKDARYFTHGLNTILTNEHSLSETDESTLTAGIDIHWKWLDTDARIFKISNQGPGDGSGILQVQFRAADTSTFELWTGIAPTFPRLQFDNEGFGYGSGTASLDTRISRTAPGVLGVSTGGFWSGATAIGNSSPNSAVAMLDVSGGFNVPTANALCRVVRVSGSIQEAASGVHARLMGLEVTAPTILAGVATVTDAATVYISGATGAVVSGNDHALWIDAGLSRFDGDVTIGGVMVLGGGIGVLGLLNSGTPPSTDTTTGVVAYSRNQALVERGRMGVNMPYQKLVDAEGAGAAITATVETAFAQVFNFPANSVKVGDVFRLTMQGVFSIDAGSDTLQVRVRWGGVAGVLLWDSGAGTPLAATILTDEVWRVEFQFIVVTVGATGTFEAQGIMSITNVATGLTMLSRSQPNTAVITVDTTTAKNLAATAQWGGTGNTITMRQWILEQIGSG